MVNNKKKKLIVVPRTEISWWRAFSLVITMPDDDLVFFWWTRIKFRIEAAFSWRFDNHYANILSGCWQGLKEKEDSRDCAHSLQWLPTRIFCRLRLKTRMEEHVGRDYLLRRWLGLHRERERERRRGRSPPIDRDSIWVREVHSDFNSETAFFVSLLVYFVAYRP